MGLFISDPYEHEIFTVKQLGEYTCRITYNRSMRKPGFELIDDTKLKPAERGTANEEKLKNNLARVKSTIKELALCNTWDYFVTLTFDSNKIDRYDLNATFKAVSEFIHNYNRRCSEEEKVVYLLIPEQHKDGAWHAHGFFKGIRARDLSINQYGYLTWKQFQEKFGFISFGKIKDIMQVSNYVLKYISKDLCQTDIGLNARSFYSSKGLKKAVTLYQGHGSFTGTWGWEHEDGYCKILEFDTRKLDIHEVFDME